MKLNIDMFLKNKKLTLMIVILVVIFIVISFFESDTENPNIYEYEKEDIQKLEKRLSDILSMVDGAGKVDVMITLHSEGEKIILKDKDASDENTMIYTEQANTVNEKTVMTKDGSKEEPFIRKITKAEIRGVIVCVDGADNQVVKNEITSACMAVLDVPINRVSVVKRRKD